MKHNTFYGFDTSAARQTEKSIGKEVNHLHTPILQPFYLLFLAQCFAFSLSLSLSRDVQSSIADSSKYQTFTNVPSSRWARETKVSQQHWQANRHQMCTGAKAHLVCSRTHTRTHTHPCYPGTTRGTAQLSERSLANPNPRKARNQPRGLGVAAKHGMMQAGAK